MASIDYQPLNSQKREIRLLRLHSAADLHSPLECELFTKSLDQDPPPQYNALSYVWGDPALKAQVKVNGRDVEVGISLATALQHMRKVHDDLIIWADAICINQTDFDERNDQVSMMGANYRGAEKVLAWLGESDEGSDLAMDFIEHWGRFSTDPEISEIANKTPMQDWPRWADELSPLSFDTHAVQAFSRFGIRSYWQRTWIIQELEPARSVEFYCSERTLSSKCVEDATWWMNLAFNMFTRQTGESFWATIALKSPLCKLIQALPRTELALIGTTSRVKFDILEAARIFWSWKATDPRDHLFGMLGMMNLDRSGSHYKLIQPDYRRSVAEVYCNFARYRMLTGRSLFPLRSCRGSGFRSDLAIRENIPTWVPDLSNLEEVWTNDIADERKLEVDGFDRLLKIIEPGNALILKGFQVDIVSTAYETLFPFWPGSDSQSSRESINQFQCDIIEGPIVREKTSLQTFVNLLNNMSKGHSLLNENQPFQLTAALLSIISSYMVQHKAIAYYQTGPSSLTEQDCINFFLARAFYPPGTDRRLIDELYNLMASKNLWNLRIHRQWFASGESSLSALVKTTHGRFGLAPKAIKEGDVLCYLAGYQYLFALRPTEGHLVFVGEVRVTDLYLPKIVPELYPYMKEFEIH